MSTTPVSSSQNLFKVNNTLNINQYVFSSIDPGASEEIQLNSMYNGVIRGIRTVNTSTDFNISIRTSAGVEPPSIDEIFKVINVDSSYNEVMLYIPYMSDDDSLYVEITNNDLVNPTGSFSFDLIFSFITQT